MFAAHLVVALAAARAASGPERAPMADENLQALHDDLEARLTRVLGMAEQMKNNQMSKNLLAVEREHRELTLKLKDLGAAVRGEDRRTQLKWHPKLRPLTDNLKELERKIAQLRTGELVRTSNTTTRTFGAQPAALRDEMNGSEADADGQPQQQQLSAAELNERESTETVRRMLRTVDETRQVGAATLVTLHSQGEQLDRIHDSVRKIHGHMDTADQHITGMKSVFGGLINKLRGHKKSVKLESDIDFVVDWLRKKKWEKKTVRMGLEDFQRVGSTGVTRSRIKYKDINGVVFAKEPNVMRLLIGRNTVETIRSPHNKMIISTLCRRARKDIAVTFEDGAQKFDLSELQEPQPTAQRSVFMRESQRSAMPASTTFDASENERLQDEMLDAVSDVLSDVKSQALTFGSELDRQNRKIADIDRDVDHAGDRVRKANFEIKKLMM